MKNIHLAILMMIVSLTSFSINAQKISLTSKGEVEVTPDIASTIINIQKTSKEADELKSKILKISKDLNKEFSKLNIEDKDIQTSNLQINKEYNWVNGKKVFKGYRASINTTVTFRNIDDLEKIYTKLLSNENITVNGIQYDYSKKDEAENDAYINALNKANVLAEKLFNETKSNAFKLSKSPRIIIESISNNGSTATPSPKPMYKALANYESMDAVSTPSIDINVGTITYTKTLTVVYNKL